MKNTESVPVSWKIAVTILVLLCLGLLISLIIVAVDYVEYKDKYPAEPHAAAACAERDGILNQGKKPKSEGLFDDLSAKEISDVRDFMLNQSALGLKNISEASVSDNYIYMIQLQLPEKDTVLQFLDEDGLKPARKALVVTFRGGDDSTPVVQEYIVEPLNDMTKMTYKTNGATIPFGARPFDQVQQRAMEKVVAQATEEAFQLLNESYGGYHYHNCSRRCLTFRPQGPFGRTINDRSTWLQFTRDIEGNYLYPVDFQLNVDFLDSNASKWKINKVYYNGRVYNTIDDLMFRYNRDSDIRTFIRAPITGETLFSSLTRRENYDDTQKPMRPPRMFEPDGKRYTVSGHHLEYMSWSFDFRVDSVSGLQVFDVRFNNTRIIYELSLQEAISFHSGFSPFSESSHFVYGGWTMGAKSYELVSGIDCPETAKFFDAVRFVDSDRPRTFKNAVCVFEMDSGIPLRRHFESDGKGGYKFYGGLASHTLVLRTIATVYNNDNIYDFIFYQNGAIEVKASSTGYLLTENDRRSETDNLGQNVQEELTGNLRNHFFHYKVDLDVRGRLNSFESINVRAENLLSQWSQGETINRMLLQRQTASLESDTEVEKIDFDTPSFYNVFNDRLGAKQGYLIQHLRTSKQLLPEVDYVTRMAPWSKFPFVITKYKPSEQKSSSLYNQNSPTVPIIDFQNYFRGQNDQIANEDLVAWVSVGSIEIPTAEGVPNMITTACSASFELRPFNFFNEDQSMVSRNAVFIKPVNEGSASGSPRVERFGTPDDEVCLPRKYEINFKGTSE